MISEERIAELVREATISKYSQPILLGMAIRVAVQEATEAQIKRLQDLADSWDHQTGAQCPTVWDAIAELKKSALIGMAILEENVLDISS